MRREKEVGSGPQNSALRTLEFWRRAGAVYLAYKGAQAKAIALRARGWDSDQLKSDHWQPHHAWAGKEFYSMAVDLRGFYLKLGQFFAARAEFVPAPICKHLSKLHDEVPPMPPRQTRRVLEGELGGTPLEDIFEWIDLEKPLGSASIAQVHKAKLRVPPGARPRRAARRRGSTPIWSLRGRLERCSDGSWRPRIAQGAWLDFSPLPPPCADAAVPAEEAAPSGRQPAEVNQQQPQGAVSVQARAAQEAIRWGEGPKNGLVAVKVQYPDALPVMMTDLTSIRKWAGFLQKTEIKFDMLSAVDELAAQVRLEFDFEREARIMDRVAKDLQPLAGIVEIPRSVAGLVTQRVLVMSFVEGTQIGRLRSRLGDLAPRRRAAAARRVLERVSRAYGFMMLHRGLFQADAHPGNILVMPGGRIGLLDYGQSKQLPNHERLAFAALILELSHGRRKASPERVAEKLVELGLGFERYDPKVMSKMAFGMFDTQTNHRVDPFADDSPLKTMGITHFPPDVFFVLRVMQLLRGLAGGMQVPDFSAAKQWAPYAREALRRGPVAG